MDSISSESTESYSDLASCFSMTAISRSTSPTLSSSRVSSRASSPASSPATSPQTTQFSKFQIFFDDSDDFQFSKPISAQLRKYSSSSSSMRPKKPLPSNTDSNTIAPTISSSSSLNSIISSPRSSPFTFTGEYFYTHEAESDSLASLKSHTAADRESDLGFGNFNKDYSPDLQDYHHHHHHHHHNPNNYHSDTYLDNDVSKSPLDPGDTHVKSFSRKSSFSLSRGTSFVSCCQKCDDGHHRHTNEKSRQNMGHVTRKIQSSGKSGDRVFVAESEEFDNCKRHHHRRGSIAIKFKNPQVVRGEKINELGILGSRRV